MLDLESLEPRILAPKMLQTASEIAGPLWAEIRTTATHEFKVLASRIREIGAAVAEGDLSKSAARILLRMARRNLIATLAMLTTMIEAAVQKLVNGVLAQIREHVNAAIGFAVL
ncbi:hypothetical protein [Sedimentitalea sp. HM32M-2]|uniref:hypothetical protein n=1 Tax=Sedimentitalea sp. HM32M-2 TaxID=3351566 RepID=UPI0036D3D8FD